MSATRLSRWGAALQRTWRADREPTLGERGATYGLVVSAIAVAAFFQSRWFDALIFSPDDAYITLHNALALRAGRDLNFPGVSPIHGATSLLHLVLVALATFLFEPTRALWITGWLGVVVYATGVARMALTLRLRAPIAIAFATLATWVGLTPMQLMNGLETGLAMGLVAWALSISEARRAGRSLPVVCALLPFARPELAALSGLLMLDRWWAARGSDRPAWRALVLRDALVFAGVAVPWLLFSFVESGQLFPSTVRAKHDFFSDACQPFDLKWSWYRYGLVTFATALGGVTLGYLGLLLRRRGLVCIVFAIVFLAAYWLEFPGAVSHYECRYLYVLAPLAFYGVATAMASRSPWLGVGALAITGVGLFQSLQAAPGRVDYIHGTKSYTWREIAPAAAWANANLPHDARVLIHDAGYVSYGTSLHLFDMVGLKSPEAARLHHEITFPSCARERHRAFDRFARESNGTHLIASRGWAPIFGFADALRENGWTLVRIRSAVDGTDGYDVFALTPPPSP